MLLGVIADIHRASRRTYGARRIHAELVYGRGLQVARCTVELVMRRNGLAGLPGRHRYRKVPNLPTAAGLVDRRFRRDEPDQLWVTNTINTRPRKSLGWKTPAEALHEHLRSLQQPGVATTG